PKSCLRSQGQPRFGSRSRSMISSSFSIATGVRLAQDFAQRQQHAGGCAPDVEAAPGQVEGLDLLTRNFPLAPRVHGRIEQVAERRLERARNLGWVEDELEAQAHEPN